MLKRTIVFGQPSYLSLKHSQLLYRPAGKEPQETVIPLEDLGVVVIEHQAITITAGLLRALENNGTVVVLCDATHHPCALLQSLSGNSVHTEVLRSQVESTKPVQKRLWAGIVSAKLKNQAALLAAVGLPEEARIRTLAREVRSGDPTNREAVGARVYWSALFEGFCRDPDGEPPNGMLNYGYAILRAAAARALVSSGLHCAIGLHHCNRYNPFCLVDDFMEPYRPFVDRAVKAFHGAHAPETALSREAKAKALGVLTTDVWFGKERSPLSVALSRSSASLVRAIQGEQKLASFPTMK